MIFKMFRLMKVFMKIQNNYSIVRLRQISAAPKIPNKTLLERNTLISRFYQYLNCDKNYVCSDLDVEEININGFRRKKLKKSSKVERLLNEIEVNALDNKNILGELDVQLCLQSLHMTYEDALRLLNIYMLHDFANAIKYDCYWVAVKKLYHFMDSLNKNQLLQLIFYTGLQNRIQYGTRVLTDCLESVYKYFLNELTVEDLCIICVSTYRTNTKITNKKLIKMISDVLNDNLNLLKDPEIFITFVKTLTHHNCSDESLLSTISCTILFNKTLHLYNFTENCYILALYAGHFYDEGDFVDIVAKTCLEQLLKCQYNEYETDFKKQPRLKDIRRFLWTLSVFNFKRLIDIILVVPKILEREEEIKENPEYMVEFMLYFWILNYRVYEFVPFIFNKDIVQFIWQSKTKAKERLNLLIHCINIEDKELFSKIDMKPVLNPSYPIEKQLIERGALEWLSKGLQIDQLHEFTRFELTFEIPYLNILGITGFKSNIYKGIFIEVLDPYTSLKNSLKPTGLMDLKLRLLGQLNLPVIVLTEAEIQATTVEMARDLVLQKIEELR